MNAFYKRKQMKKYTIIPLLTAVTCSFACADEVSIPEEMEHSPKANPHHVSIGPDLFFGRASYQEKMNFQMDYPFLGQEQLPDMHIKSHSQFYTLRAGYDFSPDDAFYAGITALYGLGSANVSIDLLDVYQKMHIDQTVANAETRFGYTFHAAKPFRITPFLGLGAYRFTGDHPWIDFSLAWLYGAVGMRSSYSINSIANIGLNLKAMRSLYMKSRLGSWRETAGPREACTWGYEIGIPITFRLGEASSWDIQVEPYFLKLDTKGRENFFGSRLAIGYNF